MPVNQFLPFGTAGSAPVLSNAAYAITPANGFGAGILPKENLNKALRQGNAMAAAVGQFILAQGFDALDNANINALASAITAAVDARVNAFLASNYAGAPNQALSANGWQRMVGGLLVQWASLSFPNVPLGNPGHSGSLNFPVAFPTACLFCTACTETTEGAINNWNVSITGTTATTASYQVQEWSSSVNPGVVRVLALGV
jgi:hypothetical protein